MLVVDGVLRETGDDTLDMEVDEVIDSPYLSLTVLVRVGSDDRIARPLCFRLDTIEDRRIIMRHEIRYDNAYDARCLFPQTLCEGVRTLVHTFRQILDLFLHFLSDFRTVA